MPESKVGQASGGDTPSKVMWMELSARVVVYSTVVVDGRKSVTVPGNSKQVRSTSKYSSRARTARSCASVTGARQQLFLFSTPHIQK